MKNIIRKFISAGAKVLFGLGIMAAAQAHAQNVKEILTGTQTIPAGLSNVVTMSVQEGKELTLHQTFNLTAAGTAGVCTIVELSLDGSKWATSPHQYFRAAAGTTPVSHLTNFTINAARYARITTHNTNNVPVTNNTFLGFNKRGI